MNPTPNLCLAEIISFRWFHLLCWRWLWWYFLVSLATDLVTWGWLHYSSLSWCRAVKPRVYQRSWRWCSSSVSHWQICKQKCVLSHKCQCNDFQYEAVWSCIDKWCSICLSLLYRPYITWGTVCVWAGAALCSWHHFRFSVVSTQHFQQDLPFSLPRPGPMCLFPLKVFSLWCSCTGLSACWALLVSAYSAASCTETS